MYTCIYIYIYVYMYIYICTYSDYEYIDRAHISIIYIYVKNEMIVIVNEYNVCICLYMYVYSVPIFRIHKTLIWIIYVVVLPITNTKQTTSWSSLSTRVHYRSISIRNIEWPCFLTSTYKYFFMGCHPIQVDGWQYYGNTGTIIQWTSRIVVIVFLIGHSDIFILTGITQKAWMMLAIRKS